jgi:hypothetical protein
MLGLDAHAARDTYLGLIVCKVMEKIHRVTQDKLNLFVFLLAATLQLHGYLKVMDND